VNTSLKFKITGILSAFLFFYEIKCDTQLFERNETHYENRLRSIRRLYLEVNEQKKHSCKFSHLVLVIH